MRPLWRKNRAGRNMIGQPNRRVLWTRRVQRVVGNGEIHTYEVSYHATKGWKETRVE